MKKHLKKIIIVLIVLVGLFVFFKIKNSSKTKITANTVVETKNLQEIVYLSGQLSALSQAKINFTADSKITWIGVKVGDAVKKYQSLAKQDTNEIEKSLKTSLNNFMASRDSFDQTIDDNKLSDQSDPKTIAEMKRIIDKSQLSLDNSVLDVEVKNLAIKKASLSSPIKGIITHIPSSPTGSYPSSDDYFEVVDPETEYISAMVSQQDVIKLKVGQTAKITLDAYREDPFDATISYISYQPIDTVNNKYEVRLTYTRQPEKYNYHLGMTGEIQVTLSQKDNALIIPRQYIISENGKRYVNLINNQVPEKKEISTGIENYQDIEIISGLQVGDTLSLPQ